jgi:hypothetical protein
VSDLRLFHFTCADHGRAGIDRDRLLRPNQHPWLDEPVVWLTDLDIAHVEALGLASHTLGCDRTAWRYEVAPAAIDDAMPWMDYRRRLTPALRRAFEESDGAMPRHWWVSSVDLPIVGWGVPR